LPNEALDIKLSDIPTHSGVYIFLDKKSRPIYIGKAKNLRSRLASYLNNSVKNIKTATMLTHAKDIKTIITTNEIEAYLLEANLIKTEQPKYNILLKDSKTYPYIKLTNERFPRLIYTRQLRSDDGDYYGPFVNVSDLKLLTNHLVHIFPLRTCRDTKFNEGKFCIKYQIKRCLAPCAKLISESEYQVIVNNIRSFFKGNIGDVKRIMTAQMHHYSKELRFEEAAAVRDRINSLTRIFSKQSVININDNRSIDLFHKHTINDIIGITKLFIRGGKLLSTTTEFFIDEINETTDLLEQYVIQYYNTIRQFPELIYLSGDDYSDSLEQVLSRFAGRKVILRKRGYSGLIDIAKENALKETDLYLRKVATKTDVLSRLATIVSLEKIKTVECVDISHLSGEHTVGVSIRSEDGNFDNSYYKKYRLTGVSNDDFLSLYQLFNRKFDNINDGSEIKADLYIIDGGIGQLSVVSRLLRERNETATLISISKSRKERKDRFKSDIDIEEIHLVGRKNPLKLKRNDQLLHFIKSMRDEAHRFAINYSRKLALNSILHSPLLDIKGIGVKRLKEILKTIPDIHNRKDLTKHDLQQLTNLPDSIIDNLLAYLLSTNINK